MYCVLEKRKCRNDNEAREIGFRNPPTGESKDLVRPYVAYRLASQRTSSSWASIGYPAADTWRPAARPCRRCESLLGMTNPAEATAVAKPGGRTLAGGFRIHCTISAFPLLPDAEIGMSMRYAWMEWKRSGIRGGISKHGWRATTAHTTDERVRVQSLTRYLLVTRECSTMVSLRHGCLCDIYNPPCNVQDV